MFFSINESNKIGIYIDKKLKIKWFNLRSILSGRRNMVDGGQSTGMNNQVKEFVNWLGY